MSAAARADIITVVAGDGGGHDHDHGHGTGGGHGHHQAPQGTRTEGGDEHPQEHLHAHRHPAPGRSRTRVNAIKADGTYDDFIERHHHSMMTPTLMAGRGRATNTSATSRTAGPAFLPWHRYFCREFELAAPDEEPDRHPAVLGLGGGRRRTRSGAARGTPIPRNAFTSAAMAPGPTATVTTGPFAGWTALSRTSAATSSRGRAGILRELGRNHDFGNRPAFPTVAAGRRRDPELHGLRHVTVANGRAPAASATGSRAGSQLAGENGSQLHNRVHIWVGGDMGPGTSPNDPVFFLHHCNVDRLWALWQHAHPASTYLPASGGPPGHNLNDVDAAPDDCRRDARGLLDYRRTMGFIYDTDPPLVDLRTPTVNFQDVPTLETTWRAAVFHVRAGSTVHLESWPAAVRRRRTR